MTDSVPWAHTYDASKVQATQCGYIIITGLHVLLLLLLLVTMVMRIIQAFVVGRQL